MQFNNELYDRVRAKVENLKYDNLKAHLDFKKEFHRLHDRKPMTQEDLTALNTKVDRFLREVH